MAERNDPGVSPSGSECALICRDRKHRFIVVAITCVINQARSIWRTCNLTRVSGTSLASGLS